MNEQLDESLPERIRRRTGQLSTGQQRIARFCVNEPELAGTLTALRIGEELSLSESSVVRFAARMGYRGFPDMQTALRRVSVQGAAASTSAEGHEKLDGLAGAALRNDLRILRETIASLNEDRFAAAVNALNNARLIHVCGFRTAFSLAYLAEFHIRQVRRSVRLIDAIGGTHADDLAQIERGDAVLAFTFPVYDERTIRIVETAAQVGAECVVVTDSALAPLPLGANVHTLKVRHEGLSFFNSNVPATALLNAMVMRLLELRSTEDADIEQRIVDRFHRARVHLA